MASYMPWRGGRVISKNGGEVNHRTKTMGKGEGIPTPLGRVLALILEAYTFIGDWMDSVGPIMSLIKMPFPIKWSRGYPSRPVSIFGLVGNLILKHRPRIRARVLLPLNDIYSIFSGL